MPFIITVKNSPTRVDDFINFEKQKNETEFCSSKAETLNKKRQIQCGDINTYEECLLEATESKYYNPQRYEFKNIRNIHQPSNNSVVEIPDMLADNPVKIYFRLPVEDNLNISKPTIILHGFNSKTSFSHVYVGLLVNPEIYGLCANDSSFKNGSWDKNIINIKVTSSAAGCYFWNDTEDKWSQDGCKVI